MPSACAARTDVVSIVDCGGAVHASNPLPRNVPGCGVVTAAIPAPDRCGTGAGLPPGVGRALFRMLRTVCSASGACRAVTRTPAVSTPTAMVPSRLTADGATAEPATTATSSVIRSATVPSNGSMIRPAVRRNYAATPHTTKGHPVRPDFGTMARPGTPPRQQPDRLARTEAAYMR